ncbi:hypothetical protein B0H11DRAFT_2426733 [Mycena galericulata]|nr:hypothetical protein B0H11DRAFT_2426733 [Mycena galericulata]
MPPKAKLREEDFSYSEDHSKVQCKTCVGKWILIGSAARHLTSPEHLKSTQLAKDESLRLKELERERQTQSATTDLRSIEFAAPSLDIPNAGPSRSYAARGEEIEMWRDYEISGADFSAGDDPEDPRILHERLRKEADSLGVLNPDAVATELGFGNADVGTQILEEDEEDDFLSEIMANAGIEDPDPQGIQSDGPTRTSTNAKWFPYPNKMMFLLDSIDNLPRLRISSSQMRVFLWTLKEAGCKDVPSFDRLRQVQKSIRSECGVPTIPCKSVQGNVFFMNDPTAIIAQDWSNPTTRKLIHVYPEIPKDGIIREIWHAQKWCKNMDLDMLSPMYDSGASHYYVNEVSRLKNGLFVIPVRWIIVHDKLHADVFSISFDDQGEATVKDTETSLICADEFVANYLDLEHDGKIPKWTAETVEAGHPSRMPNPKRAIAGGHPLYHSFVDYFSDDVSGNRTKSWNKHWNAYMTHRNLPRQALQQEFHVHFVSTSPNATATEQFKEFKTAVESFFPQLQVQDEDGNTTCFCIYVNSGPSDNPMQSEISSHIGGKGNRFCRKCQVGGTQKEKASNDGYHALFESGLPRTKENILGELENQVKLACSGVSQRVKDSQTETGVKDIDNPTRSNTDIEEELVQWTRANSDKIYSPFLTMKGFDPTRDTPVEILHTILLGLVKYIWHISHTPWSEEQKRTYSLRLQSTTTDGLSIHAIRAKYIMQYAGSLIGRQFKTLIQTNIFHVRGLVTEHQFMAWKAAGELSALLWVPEIRNLAEYRKDLKVAVANVLDICAMIDPSKIITKIKYHLLVHIDDDAVEFGPLIGVMTEIFECFNGVFRFCSIFSNHLSPSRDIAIQLGDQEGLKHRLTGGSWRHGSSGDRQTAGPGVRQFIAKHPLLQKLLGWTENKILVHARHWTIVLLVPGFSRSPQLTRQVKFTPLDDTDPKKFQTCTISGRISDILQNNDSVVLVVLELFQISSQRDELYGMPVANIKFNVNVQHDCHTAKCEATGVRMQMQERVESEKTENYIVHNTLDRYIINSHAFHNAHLLRATLPRDLLAPVPLFEDRRQKHDEFATALRGTLETKRAKKKAAATLKRKANFEEDTEIRPGKKRKSNPGRRRTSALETDTMVANRSRRQITRSAKAAAMSDESDDDLDTGGSELDEEDLYHDSGEDYSE